jgi:hypothetical protein
MGLVCFYRLTFCITFNVTSIPQSFYQFNLLNSFENLRFSAKDQQVLKKRCQPNLPCVVLLLESNINSFTNSF